MKRARWFVLCAALSLGSSSVEADDIGDSIDVTMMSRAPNQYFFRGQLQNDKGFIAQASSELAVALYDTELVKFMTLAGFWLSVHPGNEQKGSDVRNVPAAWYESRMEGGAGFVYGGVDAFGRLAVYSSPNGSFNDIYELKLNVGFRDDTIWAGDDEDTVFRGIFPQVVLAHEVSGARDGGKSGTYGELAVAPRLRLLYGAALGVDVAFPVSLGMSLGDYYEVPSGPAGAVEDQFLGYASAGVLIDIATRFVPERLGLWNVRPSLDVLFPTAQNAVSNAKTDTAEIVGMVETVLNF